MRYYLCRVLGDGTDDNPYRAHTHDLGSRSYGVAMPSHENGHPVHKWTVVATGDDEEFDPHGEVVDITDGPTPEVQSFCRRHKVDLSVVRELVQWHL